MTVQPRGGRGKRSRPARAFSVLAVPLLLSIPAGCDPVPDYLREDIQAQRMAETGLENPDPSGTSASAGLSALRSIEVQAIDPKRVGSDTLSPGFHRLVHRCGTCHDTPSPEMRSAAEWKYVFSRMEKHMKDTGLIPLSDEDQDLILAFLQRHAGSR